MTRVEGLGLQSIVLSRRLLRRYGVSWLGQPATSLAVTARGRVHPASPLVRPERLAVHERQVEPALSAQQPPRLAPMAAWEPIPAPGALVGGISAQPLEDGSQHEASSPPQPAPAQPPLGSPTVAQVRRALEQQKQQRDGAVPTSSSQSQEPGAPRFGARSPQQAAQAPSGREPSRRLGAASRLIEATARAPEQLSARPAPEDEPTGPRQVSRMTQERALGETSSTLREPPPPVRARGEQAARESEVVRETEREPKRPDEFAPPEEQRPSAAAQVRQAPPKGDLKPESAAPTEGAGPVEAVGELPLAPIATPSTASDDSDSRPEVVQPRHLAEDPLSTQQGAHPPEVLGLQPQGEAAQPQGEAAQPQGEAAQPQGDTARPQGDTARPPSLGETLPDSVPRAPDLSQGQGSVPRPRQSQSAARLPDDLGAAYRAELARYTARREPEQEGTERPSQAEGIGGKRPEDGPEFASTALPEQLTEEQTDAKAAPQTPASEQIVRQDGRSQKPLASAPAQPLGAPAAETRRTATQDAGTQAASRPNATEPTMPQGAGPPWETSAPRVGPEQPLAAPKPIPGQRYAPETDAAPTLQTQPVRLERALELRGGLGEPPVATVRPVVASSDSAPSAAAPPTTPLRRAEDGGTQAPTSTTETEAPKAESAQQPSATAKPNIDEIAEKVYWKLRDRLRVERERSGSQRYR